MIRDRTAEVYLPTGSRLPIVDACLHLVTRPGPVDRDAVLLAISEPLPTAIESGVARRGATT